MMEISNEEFKSNNNEKDNLLIVLSYLKDIVKNYLVATTEVSNETLYKQTFNTLEELSKLQRKVYEKAFYYGFYKLEALNNNKINKLYKELNEEIKKITS